MPSTHTLKMIGFGFLSAAIGVILLINAYVLHPPYIYLPIGLAAIMILIAAVTMLCTQKLTEKLADFFLADPRTVAFASADLQCPNAVYCHRLGNRPDCGRCRYRHRSCHGIERLSLQMEFDEKAVTLGSETR